MYTFENIEENRIFGNGVANLHIKFFPQSCHCDNPTRLLQGTLRKVDPQKNLILETIHGSTIETIGRPNRLQVLCSSKEGSKNFSMILVPFFFSFCNTMYQSHRSSAMYKGMQVFLFQLSYFCFNYHIFNCINWSMI